MFVIYAGALLLQTQNKKNPLTISLSRTNNFIKPKLFKVRVKNLFYGQKITQFNKKCSNIYFCYEESSGEAEARGILKEKNTTKL